MDNIHYLENICRTIKNNISRLVYKQAIEDELNISGGRHDF